MSPTCSTIPVLLARACLAQARHRAGGLWCKLHKRRRLHGNSAWHGGHVRGRSRLSSIAQAAWFRVKSCSKPCAKPCDAQIDLSAFSAPQVPPDTKPEIAVEQIDVEPGSGRFTAGLAIVVPGEPLQRLHLAGRVQALVTAVVATHRLMAGAPIQPSDVRLQRLPSGTGQDESAQNLSQVIGQALRHPLNAGQKIAVAELSAPILVQKGALVQIQLQVPGLAVTAAGTAADSGAMGDHIGVLNPASGAIIEAEITGPDQVRVLPGNALRRLARSGQTQISLR